MNIKEKEKFLKQVNAITKKDDKGTSYQAKLAVVFTFFDSNFDAFGCDELKSKMRKEMKIGVDKAIDDIK